MLTTGRNTKKEQLSLAKFTSVSPPCKDELLRIVRGQYRHVEPKRGAKHWMHHILTHHKLPLFRVLQVPPDLPDGPVMTVR